MKSHFRDSRFQISPGVHAPGTPWSFATPKIKVWLRHCLKLKYFELLHSLAPHGLRFEPYEDPFSRKLGLAKETLEQLKETPSHVPPENTTTSYLEGNVVQSPNEPVSQPTARAVWGPSGYTGNKIRKASEGPDKVVQSSFGHSSSGDLSVERPSQKCEETTGRFQVRRHKIRAGT